MKKIVLACVASFAVISTAQAGELPKLSEFLSSCYRDNESCMTKIRSYVEAAKAQKIICLTDDVSVRDAARSTLRWLREEGNYPASLAELPFDDGLYEATSKLYPCATEEPPPPPVPPPAEPPATDPAATPAQ